MYRLVILSAFLLGLVFLLTSCRPPELEGAVVHYNAKRYNDALVQAKKAVEMYPDNAEAWYYYGSINGELKNYDEMIKGFEKAESLSKDFDVKILYERNKYFADTFNSGVRSYNQYSKLVGQDTEKAKESITEAIKMFGYANRIKPNYNAGRMIAISYQILGDNNKALESYQKLTNAFPDSAEAWASLGSIYFSNKDYDQTIANLNKALAIDSTNAQALTLLAQTYDYQKQTQKAIETYRKAIRYNQDEKALPFNLGLMLVNTANAKGTAEADKNKYLSEAISLFEKVLKMDPEFKEAYQLKGQSELLLQRNEDALKTLQKGLELYPEDANMWYNISIAYTRLNNKKEAEKAYAKAQELDKK